VVMSARTWALFAAKWLPPDCYGCEASKLSREAVLHFVPFIGLGHSGRSVVQSTIHIGIAALLSLAVIIALVGERMRDEVLDMIQQSS
jgi:hypothetical protein